MPLRNPLVLNEYPYGIYEFCMSILMKSIGLKTISSEIRRFEKNIRVNCIGLSECFVESIGFNNMVVESIGFK